MINRIDAVANSINAEADIQDFGQEIQIPGVFYQHDDGTKMYPDAITYDEEKKQWRFLIR